MASKFKPSSSYRLNLINNDDDDFQIPLTQTSTPRKPYIKKPKLSAAKDSNFKPIPIQDCCSLDSIPEPFSLPDDITEPAKPKGGYLCNSLESKLIRSSRVDWGLDCGDGDESPEELDVLLRLNEIEEEDDGGDGIVDDDENKEGLVECPLCGSDISDLSDEERQLHTNACLDKTEDIDIQPQDENKGSRVTGKVLDWLRSLGLEKYEDSFVREEIDWDTILGSLKRI